MVPTTSFFFNDPATTAIYTLSLHDALPIYVSAMEQQRSEHANIQSVTQLFRQRAGRADRKSTRLNSSHRTISYAVFCLKKKKKKEKAKKNKNKHGKKRIVVRTQRHIRH